METKQDMMREKLRLLFVRVKAIETKVEELKCKIAAMKAGTLPAAEWPTHRTERER